MGLSATSVKAALRDKLERTGRFCLEVTEALEVAFDYDEIRRQVSSGSGLQRDGVVARENVSIPEVYPASDITQVSYILLYLMIKTYLLFVRLSSFSGINILTLPSSPASPGCK